MPVNAITVATTQGRDLNSNQPSLSSVNTEVRTRFSMGATLSRQIKIPATRNEIASTNRAGPEPKRVTIVPPRRAPTTKPKLPNKPTRALPSFSFSLGTIAGRIPVIAGHHSALSIPNTKPINTSRDTDAKPKIKDAALIATEILPRISAPPTIRFRLKRSPITPPNNISAIIGKIRADITMLKSFPVAPSRLNTP